MRLALFLLALPMAAQVAPNAAGRVPFASATGVGPVMPYIDQSQLHPPPTTYSITVTVAGTAPTVCTWRFEVSQDGSTWFPLTQPMSCAASWTYQQQYGGFTFGRVNALTYTAAVDGTTNVTWAYTRGR